MFWWDWLQRWFYRAIQLAVLLLLIAVVLGLIGGAPAHDFAPHVSPFVP